MTFLPLPYPGIKTHQHSLPNPRSTGSKKRKKSTQHPSPPRVRTLPGGTWPLPLLPFRRRATCALLVPMRPGRGHLLGRRPRPTRALQAAVAAPGPVRPPGGGSGVALQVGCSVQSSTTSPRCINLRSLKGKTPKTQTLTFITDLWIDFGMDCTWSDLWTDWGEISQMC
jgi:hypothetical protein